MGHVVPVHQFQHCDGFFFGVDDPILRDTRLSVFGPFDTRVALHVVGADDFYYQVSTKPEGILIARIMDIKE